MTQGLVALVKSKTAITDLIGSNPTRFYPRMLPQGLSTFPAGTFRMVDNIDTSDSNGASTYDFAMIDIHSYGRTYGDAEGLYEAMRTALVDENGVYAGIDLDYVWYSPSGDEDYLDDLQLYTKRLELKIAYRRTP